MGKCYVPAITMRGREARTISSACMIKLFPLPVQPGDSEKAEKAEITESFLLFNSISLILTAQTNSYKVVFRGGLAKSVFISKERKEKMKVHL